MPVWRSAEGYSRQGYEAYEQEAPNSEREGTILSGALLRTQERFERRRQRLERETQEFLTSVS